MQIKNNTVIRPKEGLTKFFTWEYDISIKESTTQTSSQLLKQEIAVEEKVFIAPIEIEPPLDFTEVEDSSVTFNDNFEEHIDFELDDFTVLLENTINENDVFPHKEVFYDEIIETTSSDEFNLIEKQEILMPKEDYNSNDILEIQIQEAHLETSDIIENEPDNENNFGEYSFDDSPKRKKRYLSNKDFGRLAIIFGDRRIQYFFYSALFFISSTIAATLIYKFSQLDISFPLSIINNYLSYGQSLQKTFLCGLLYSAPLLLSSLFVYLAGYTIYAKVISSIWMLSFGFFWSIFAINSFSTFDVSGKILFSVLSAILINASIILAAESGKYSQLTTYGKAELIKLSNIKHFTFIYIAFTTITWFINFLFIKLVF